LNADELAAAAAGAADADAWESDAAAEVVGVGELANGDHGVGGCTIAKDSACGRECPSRSICGMRVPAVEC
jgi:hypothetical protein